MNDNQQVKDSWNNVYASGDKYQNEPPIPFIKIILSTLKEQNLLKGKGLYIGCGNGRNYIPLVEQELDLIGLDISDVALKGTSRRKSEITNKLVCSSFLDYQPSQNFDYIIAIQVFQHGNYDEVLKSFQKVASILKADGLFFLRNRSDDTLTSEKYEVIEKTKYKGFTVKYLTGSKKNLEIHFLSKGEIDQLSNLGLEPIIEPYKIETPQKESSKKIVHWEGIWRRTSSVQSPIDFLT